MIPRLLEALLRLYPPGFRERYEAEMREAIGRDRARGRRVSALALAGNALFAWADLGWQSIRRGSFFDLRGLRRARGFGAVVIFVVAVIPGV